MAKKKNTPLKIFMESLRLYFSNFDKFIKYMTFPVLGQIGGLGLVLLLSFFYAKNLPTLIQKVPAIDNFNVLLLIAVLITLPGLAIFVKAFWEYLVAYGAVNSMYENMSKSGKVYDFDAHTELVTRRVMTFIVLWALFSVFTLFATFPLFWVPCAVLAIYFVLIFQVFTFEPEQSPVGCVKRSLELVKGNFLPTFMLLALIGALTYFLVPNLVNLFCEYTGITNFFSTMILPIIKELPIAEWNEALLYFHLKQLNIESIAKTTVAIFIAQIFIQYTLPLRSILWSMWYRNLNGGKLYKEVDLKHRKKTSKKPSEKLMEESHKKFAAKKLDRNILRRAMEKDED